MLNEIYEYEQYMARVDYQGKHQVLTPAKYIEKYGTRLGYRRLVTSEKMQGLKRPLILIARRLLSESYKEEIVVECLKSWCGMTGKINEQYKNDPVVCDLQDILPDYIEYVLGYKKDEKRKEAAQKRRKELTSKDWAKAAFNFDIDTSDYHGIRFERIVAEALVCNEIVGKGLDRYYLLSTECTSETELFRDVFWKEGTTDFASRDNKQIQGQKNKILMAVAEKLMKDQTEHSRWFAKVDFENWIQESSGNSNGFDPIKFEDRTQGRVCLFSEKKLVSSQEDKELVINENWNNRCGWKVVTKEKLKDVLLEYIKYRSLESKDMQNVFPIFFRDYYFEEDNCKEKGIYLQRNRFYLEEKTFWEKAAKENEKITGFAELYRRSFGEE